MDTHRVDTGVLQSHRQLGRARAAARHPAKAPLQQLEVGVPDPGDIATVGDVVVQDAKQIVFAGLEREGSQHLVCTGWILDEHDLEPRWAPRPPAAAGSDTVTVSARPNAGLVASRPAAMRPSGMSRLVASAAAASAL